MGQGTIGDASGNRTWQEAGARQELCAKASATSAPADSLLEPAEQAETVCEPLEDLGRDAAGMTFPEAGSSSVQTGSEHEALPHISSTSPHLQRVSVITHNFQKISQDASNFDSIQAVAKRAKRVSSKLKIALRETRSSKISDVRKRHERRDPHDGGPASPKGPRARCTTVHARDS